MARTLAAVAIKRCRQGDAVIALAHRRLTPLLVEGTKVLIDTRNVGRLGLGHRVDAASDPERARRIGAQAHTATAAAARPATRRSTRISARARRDRALGDQDRCRSELVLVPGE